MVKRDKEAKRPRGSIEKSLELGDIKGRAKILSHRTERNEII